MKTIKFTYGKPPTTFRARTLTFELHDAIAGLVPGSDWICIPNITRDELTLRRSQVGPGKGNSFWNKVRKNILAKGWKVVTREERIDKEISNLWIGVVEDR